MVSIIPTKAKLIKCVDCEAGPEVIFLPAIVKNAESAERQLQKAQHVPL